MAVVYAKSFVDRRFEERDIFEIYSIVYSLRRERNLSERCDVFLKLWDWCCRYRSGIWQYYENCQTEEIEDTCRLFAKFGLHEIATHYRSGVKTWRKPEMCQKLDDWIRSNWKMLESLAIDLVTTEKALLYPPPMGDASSAHTL